MNTMDEETIKKLMASGYFSHVTVRNKVTKKFITKDKRKAKRKMQKRSRRLNRSK